MAGTAPTDGEYSLGCLFGQFGHAAGRINRCDGRAIQDAIDGPLSRPRGDPGFHLMTGSVDAAQYEQRGSIRLAHADRLELTQAHCAKIGESAPNLSRGAAGVQDSAWDRHRQSSLELKDQTDRGERIPALGEEIVILTNLSLQDRGE